jgi:curli biogenesis system outer membrane secretion channel CsgG
MKNVVYKIGLICLLLSPLAQARTASLNNYGPQIRVAVAQFGATDRFAAEYGGWNIGGGLAAQLMTALIETQRVIVVERAVLSKVLMEQELGQARLSSSMTQVQSGQLLGVDYLIVGQVTEFEQQAISGGGSFGVLKGIGPKVSSDVQAAHVAIDMRIIDTRTGEILHSYRASGKAWGKSFGFKMKNALVDFGGEIFHKTPLGKATRRSITSAVDFILGSVESQVKELNWLARVIDVQPHTQSFYIDAGKVDNVHAGDLLTVHGVEKVLTDPETNEILGLVEHVIGTARVISAEQKYAQVEMVNQIPPIGSLVRFADRHRQKLTPAVTTAGYSIME